MNDRSNGHELIDRLGQIVGAEMVLTEAGDMAPWLIEERGLYESRALSVVRPGNTEEVAKVIRLCADNGVAVVPQGGNTGLVGGAVAGIEGDEIILGLGRLDRIREIDPRNNTMTVDAGCILENIQNAAAEVDRYFPLSLASEGSCQIGGNISTNAGGTAVLRFGNARDLVLGLEVVLADGRIWNGLRGLRKDNTGYDLKQLFMGSEGTLGVITAAVLKLFPAPRQIVTAFAGVSDVASAMELLGLAQGLAGESVTAFEIVPGIGVEFVVRHIEGATDPLGERHNWYVLLELHSAHPGSDLHDVMEEILGEGHAQELIADATIAGSGAQRQALWRIRETLPEAQKHEGGSIKHDVSVPVSKVPAFMAEASRAVEAALPGIRIVAFGHLGDGNIHFNLSQPEGTDRDAFIAEWGRFNDIVHGIVGAHDGSISAEHGIGILKREEITRFKSDVEMDLMRTLKRTFDPQAILNPGKVV